MPDRDTIQIRPAREDDIPALMQLEMANFASDRLSKRRMRHWVQADNRIFLVLTMSGVVSGYCLILLHKGTRLARLYSIAVDGSARGKGLGRLLLTEGEEKAADQGRLFMRLEVARNNLGAIRLYESMGYVIFGEKQDYYQDHQDALRMQKRIRYLPQNLLTRKTPWYRQTTEFTCGPAALMMAMASLDAGFVPDRVQELSIWREATTIYMTTGHGGCHPVGLGLAAKRRGFRARVLINRDLPLFLDGVRTEQKREVLAVVDEEFHRQAEKAGVAIHVGEFRLTPLEQHLNDGGAVIILISTYRLDGKKAPHWVTITGMDDLCFYIHDPSPSGRDQVASDCQHIPVARADFEKMSAFGKQRLRTAVLVSTDREPSGLGPAAQQVVVNAGQ